MHALGSGGSWKQNSGQGHQNWEAGSTNGYSILFDEACSVLKLDISPLNHPCAARCDILPSRRARSPPVPRPRPCLIHLHPPIPRRRRPLQPSPAQKSEKNSIALLLRSLARLTHLPPPARTPFPPAHALVLVHVGLALPPSRARPRLGGPPGRGGALVERAKLIPCSGKLLEPGLPTVVVVVPLDSDRLAHGRDLILRGVAIRVSSQPTTLVPSHRGQGPLT